MNQTKRKKRRRKRKIQKIISAILAYAILIVAAILLTYSAMYIYDLVTGKETKSFGEELTQIVFSQEEKKESDVFHGEGTGKHVVLDAGHGGEDGGTIGKHADEKDVNLAVTEYLKEYLEQAGVKVTMTRTKDEYLSLDERTELANQTDAELFVSIHCNYYEGSSSIYGLECYHYPGMDDGQACAETLLDAMREQEEIHVRNVKEEDFYVLKHTQMTAILVELGYLSNNKECKNLADTSYQKMLAQALTKGILKSLDSNVSFE